MTAQELNRANELVKEQATIKDMMEMAKIAVMIRKPVIKGLKNIFDEEVAESFVEEVSQFALKKLTAMLQKKYDDVIEELEKI